ncbi:hypothetical protein [Streptomyces sp. NBC_01438]|uniref:hypothetical protein n=1 Tax=Streptomyces sp. NBC_01438 TaxID=2903866 RepID=UPI003249092C
MEELTAGRLAVSLPAREGRQGSPRVVADHLVEGADPERRLSITPSVADPPVQLCRALEEIQFTCVLDSFVEEPGMDQAATGRSEVYVRRPATTRAGQRPKPRASDQKAPHRLTNPSELAGKCSRLCGSSWVRALKAAAMPALALGVVLRV